MREAQNNSKPIPGQPLQAYKKSAQYNVRALKKYGAGPLPKIHTPIGIYFIWGMVFGLICLLILLREIRVNKKAN